MRGGNQTNNFVNLAPAQLLHVYDLNYNKSIEAHEVITCISVYQQLGSTQDPLIAVSTIQNNLNGNNEGKLKAMHIYKINQTSNQIEFVFYQDFGWGQNLRSMYYWIDFTHMFRGENVLFAFQNDDQKKLDVYVMTWNMAQRKWVLDLVYSQPGFNSEYFTAIASKDDKIFSVDYDGVMKILTIPT